MPHEEFRAEQPPYEPPAATREDHARHIAAGIEVGPYRHLSCRDVHNELGCSLGLHGDEAAVIAAAVQHAGEAHGLPDTPALRERIRRALRDERGR